MAQLTKRTIADGTYRYDVRYRIGTEVRTKTFRRRRDANAFATKIEADRLKGVVIDPRRAQVTVRDYAGDWLKARTDLADSTKELYGYLLDHHVLPTFGETAIGKVTPSSIRSWHAEIARRHSITAAKAYRLLGSVMRTAVADEVIARNPCQVKGAAVERSPERPVATVAEVSALTEAMPDHLRLVVLLACWCQLRRGEVLGLRRRDVDLMHGTVTVEQSRTFTMTTGTALTKGPKTASGRRTLSVPSNVSGALKDHLDRFVAPHGEALVFTGEHGGPLVLCVLDRAWQKARASIGRPELRLHDLRHTGLTLAAATGATVAELMHRAGHASTTAALRYQHATRDRDRVLAEALAGLATSATVTEIGPRDGRAMDPPEQRGGRTAHTG